MGNYIDLTGQRFGRLLVLRRVGSKGKSPTWYCKCDCGNEKIVSTSGLKSGNTQSCGCLRQEQAIENNKHRTTHGKSKTKLYNVWFDIKRRCYNPKRENYKDYGGREIKICDEWKNNFEKFYNWANENGYKEGLSIDRIDVNGDYEPKNCRWVDNYTQANNKTNNFLITYNGETHTATEWSKIVGIKATTILHRIKKYGWSIEKALNTKVK